MVQGDRMQERGMGWERGVWEGWWRGDSNLKSTLSGREPSLRLSHYGMADCSPSEQSSSRD